MYLILFQIIFLIHYQVIVIIGLMLLNNYLPNYYLILQETQDLRFQREIWENAGERVVVSGQIDKRMISADWTRRDFR